MESVGIRTFPALFPCTQCPDCLPIPLRYPHVHVLTVSACLTIELTCTCSGVEGVWLHVVQYVVLRVHVVVYVQ